MIPDINLLPHVGKSESDSKVLYSVIVAVAVIAIILIFWKLFEVNSDNAYLSNKQQQLQLQKGQLQVESGVLLNRNTGSFAVAVNFIERVAYPVTPLMDEVTKLLPQHAYLRKYTFGTNIVNIAADVETITAISNYIAQLEKSEYFNEVQLEFIKSVEQVSASSSNTVSDDASDATKRSYYEATIKLSINELYLAGGTR